MHVADDHTEAAAPAARDALVLVDVAPLVTALAEGRWAATWAVSLDAARLGAAKRLWSGSSYVSLRSGQVRFITNNSTRPKSRTMSESHNLKAAFATSELEVTSLESNYARIIRDDTAEPTTNVAENHNDVLQAHSSGYYSMFCHSESLLLEAPRRL